MKNSLLLVIIVAVLLTCARPPWRRIYRDRNIKTFESVEYAWLWNPPAKASTVDFGRVVLQLGALLFLGACIVFSRYIFSPIEDKTKKRLSKRLIYATLFLLVGFLLYVVIMYVGNNFFRW